MSLISRVVSGDANVKLLLKCGFVSCLGQWGLI